jgi:ParB family chromosome partitioning protein
MAKPAPNKPSFGAGVLSGLRATVGKTGGEPLFLPLDQIEEDPEQPRTVFDQDELEQLAETIRLYGVLTPIGVRKLDGNRYRLVYGARRVRASRLAEQTRIPATILADEKAGLAAQVIENQARAGLSNRDLAAAVNRLFGEGMRVKQIAAVCNLKEYQVAAFRSVERLPAVLAERLDRGDMRAIYDLFREWERHPAEIEAAMLGEDVFLTVTEARRVIATATGKATSSVFLDRAKGVLETVPVPDETAADPSPAPVHEPAQDAADLHSASATVPAEAPAPAVPKSIKPSRAAPAPAAEPAARQGPPVFIMRAGEPARPARDEQAGRGGGLRRAAR